MTACPDRKRRITAYIAGGLGRGAAQDLERHLRACLECADAVDRLRAGAAGLDEAVRGLVRRDGPSDRFEARLHAAIEAQPHPRRGRWSPAVAVPAAAAVLVIAALIAALLLPGRTGRNGSEETMVEMSEWRASSDWLLVSMADELLESETVIDEYYFTLEIETTNGKGGGS